MSDRFYSLLYLVKLWRTCLVIMSCLVLLCQTMSNIVLSEDVMPTIWWSWEELDWGDVVSKQEMWPLSSPDTMSDSLLWWEADPMLSDTISQSGTDITLSLSDDSMSDIWSGASQELWWVIVTWSGGLIDNSIDIAGLSWDITPPQPDEIRLETPISTKEIAPQPQQMSFAVPTSFVVTTSPPQLSITEVRIDGTDEYIEITNRWDPFVGSVIIWWVKSSSLTVSLDVWTNE